MKISLVQIDGKWANLALMKLSAYHKSIGDYVSLNGTDADRVYISCVFRDNRAKAYGIKAFYESLGMDVVIGGSGINLQTTLSEKIENMIPDYSLYGLDYSLGFTSRGCIRNCSFCIVPKKEGKIREVPMNWIQHKKVRLLDNNFTASPTCCKKLKFFEEENLQICFTQGLDIRLINNKLAKALSNIDARNNKFSRRCYYFAFDHPELETTIKKKHKILVENGIPPYCQLYYILCGFNTTHEQDLRRVSTIHNLGSMAFVMKYHNKDQWLNRLANWCNRRYYKVCKFEDFDKAEWRKNH